jgi:hypothetical protein
VGEPDYVRLGRRGGNTTASTRDMRPVAAHARKSGPNYIEAWLDKVDPEHELAPADREIRARAAQSLWYSDLANRRHKKNGAQNAVEAGPQPTSTVTADHDEKPRHESGPV